jgi:DHA1 family multidrug resistance protein B-like MFS transporter
VKGKSDAKTMLYAMAVNIVGYTYLVFSNQPTLLILLMLLATVGELIYVPIRQTYLVHIVPDHARSTYMAINGMVHRVALMLCGLNIVIGGFLPSGGMAVVIFLTGMTGLFILASLIPSLQTTRLEPKGAASTKAV